MNYNFQEESEDLVLKRGKQSVRVMDSLLNGGSQGGGGMVEITYSELKDLRDQNELVPGCFYRITDYVTTVSQLMEPDARSAGHQFDVVVFATGTNTLNENAKAVRHAGDTYFKDCNLDAWQLKYTLDNIHWAQSSGYYIVSSGFALKQVGNVFYDGTEYILWEADNKTATSEARLYYVSENTEIGTTIYQWDNELGSSFYTIKDGDVVTPESNGKGIITWMKDENGNECPYDFKNIQFKRWKKGRDKYIVYSDNGNNYIWVYTFSSSINGGEQSDMSIVNVDVKHNIIKTYMYGLNNIVFYGYSCYSNTFGHECHDNTFGNNCNSNTFGDNCGSNVFGDDYGSNTFGHECHNNTFGDSCYNNTFGNECNYNTFGNHCYNNTFGDSCQNNTFGDNCTFNQFGNHCYNNTFGNDCLYNTFGTGCNNNKFRDSCQSNMFGNNCQSNTFGYNCLYNQFGNECHYIKFGTSSAERYYCRYIIVESGNKNIYLNCSATTSDSAYFQNVKIAQGVNNTNSYKTITHTTAGDTFQTVYKPTGSVDINV